MEMTGAVLAIAGAITLGAMSPGPSFLMVARVSIAASRADGLAAALGMGAGGVLFAVMALAGLHVVLIAVPWLYAVLKIAGGAYLIFIGWMIWRAARQPVLLADGSGNAPRTPRRPRPCRAPPRGRRRASARWRCARPSESSDPGLWRRG